MDDTLNQDKEKFTVSITFTRQQILEFFGNMTEMYHDSDEKYMEESFCSDEKQKEKMASKQDLGYGYLYINPNGEKYITMGEEHEEKFMNGLEYHLKHSPHIVMAQLQKILFATDRAHEIMDNTMDFGREELVLETMEQFQIPMELRAEEKPSEKTENMSRIRM